MFKGSMTALITPFKNGAVDDKAFEAFVEWQISEGTKVLVPCGTTGESPTLTHAEHRHVNELCVKVAAGRVPVIAGAGSNSTAEAVEFIEHAESIGADAALVVAPYYNKPTQEGLYQHFKAVNDAGNLPIIVYNIPGRSIVDISVETMARMAELPNIVGVKDATADLKRPMLTRLAIGADFCQLSGEDATAVPFLAGGGHGCISVSANVAPRLCADMHEAWNVGDMAKTMEIQDRLMPLHETMFCESSPGPAKYALSLMGKCTDELRLPLCEVAQSTKVRVEETLRTVGLLN
ncbi:MAG: 4-hydroxy-tetrahydrodipicolinate synthase [Rhodospirillales bacterium]|mgnify:CR=1 FL=1|jgi:4-hydroxy-tetrahydrodipicolinate synthase|nr:4-hydroxy-tetrahydrodipicolinate synthase [Rhodospirillales bacterium]MBT4041687.1 4-hydroxy-tetrahydrodipicolinate synthase [Rhodospirillales bacterium]MBT4626391.1 4-hydroxy-tetrahydrodipicolinate synthase [Rhodospirillales bacterium]MBT5350121.1 4-hydroxy-tetrahydrodipicolinate synthase [Rhodospirillales bacterium]MBT5520365.1 4-hydroxy-tetrahydrodipicolinate synthase [Rhodospirillales bacterium]